MEKPKSLADIPGFKPMYPKAQINRSDVKTIGTTTGQGYDVIAINGMFFTVDYPKQGLIPDPRTNLPNLRNMEIREDDVFICAYPKSGTHWTWEIVKMLQSGTTEYSKDSKGMSMLEFQSTENLEKLTSPRVFNTHLLFECLPTQLIDKKSKVIFLQRNPKDVAVSFLNHLINIPVAYKPDWNDFVQHFQEDEVFFCAWSKYLSDWEENLKKIPEENLLMTYYEDLKKDPIFEIKRMAKFLDKKWEDKFIEEIAEKCAFPNMKADRIKDAEAPDVDVMKKLSVPLYRKGKVGDWKNWFTVAQNEQFDLYLERALKNSKFVYRYE